MGTGLFFRRRVERLGLGQDFPGWQGKSGENKIVRVREFIAVVVVTYFALRRIRIARWMRHLRRSEQKRAQLPPSSTIVTITTERPPQLKDLEITVECKSDSQMELGMKDGRPVAFFILNILGGFHSVAIGVRPGDRGFSVSDFTRANRASFTLNRGDCVPSLCQGQDLFENFSLKTVTLDLYIWLDGGWRMYQTMLDPGFQSEPCVSRRPNYGFLTLDHFYEKRRGVGAD